jgi:hypothetical protein
MQSRRRIDDRTGFATAAWARRTESAPEGRPTLQRTIDELFALLVWHGLCSSFRRLASFCCLATPGDDVEAPLELLEAGLAGGVQLP